MQQAPGRLALTLSTAMLCIASTAAMAQQSELEITMDVIEDLSDIEKTGFLTAKPDEASLFELDPGSEEAEEEARRSLFDQFSAMDGEFRVLNEDDGFETDPAEARSQHTFETESHFDVDEKIELDLVEDITDPVDPDPMT